MPQKFERVVITGMGLASPLGCRVEEFWQGLLSSQSGVVRLEGEEYSQYPIHIGALVAGYEPSEYFSHREARRMSRSSQLGLIAAAQAIEQSCLQDGEVNLLEVGVMIGSSIGGYTAADPSFRDFYTRGSLTPLTIPISMNTGPSANVSIRHGFQGPLLNVDAACATAAHSIGYAFNLIRMGVLQVAVAGGADCPFAAGVVTASWTMRALSGRNDDPAHACRPFSADRDGLVLGEGAGVLVLEAESHARARGAEILAEVKGFGASSDSYHLTQPSVDGPLRAMRNALEYAQLKPEEIDYINAHGTGTQWNDKNETAAVKQAFGEHAYKTPIVGIKGAIGHSIGASGALEMIACVLSIRDQVVPPTINYSHPDPECDLDYVPEGKRQLPTRNVMSNSFAFGGSNSVLVVSAYQPY